MIDPSNISHVGELILGRIGFVGIKIKNVFERLALTAGKAEIGGPRFVGAKEGTAGHLDIMRFGAHIAVTMKASEADILIVPGYTNSGPDHWQSRWQARLKTARRVEQDAWAKPVREDWIGRMADYVNATTRPVVIVAHSLGVATAVQAIPHYRKPVAGAFFVAPPEVDNPDVRPRHLMTFGPYPRDPLPFPSVVVASRNDPFGSYEEADDIASAWGSLMIDAGNSGHLNADSGHGPWPEGTMVFAKFMARLQA